MINQSILVSDLEDIQRVASHAEFEDIIESSFADFPGSMVCNHYVGGNNIESHEEWTRKMLMTRDNAFVLFSSGRIPFLT